MAVDVYTDIKTCWSGTNPLYPLQSALWVRLVPKSGEARTTHGELFRLVGRLYYDCYNNGGGNIAMSWQDAVALLKLRRERIVKHMQDAANFDVVFSLFQRAIDEGRFGEGDGEFAETCITDHREWSWGALEDVLNGVILLAAITDAA